MKLPEPYEKWINEQFPKSSSLVLTGMRAGARRMYVKLMEDFAPAIEALKFYGDKAMYDASDIVEGVEIMAIACDAGEYALLALAALKEKGLVE